MLLLVRFFLLLKDMRGGLVRIYVCVLGTERVKDATSVRSEQPQPYTRNPRTSNATIWSTVSFPANITAVFFFFFFFCQQWPSFVNI